VVERGREYERISESSISIKNEFFIFIDRDSLSLIWDLKKKIKKSVWER